MDRAKPHEYLLGGLAVAAICYFIIMHIIPALWYTKWVSDDACDRLSVIEYVCYRR